MNQVRTLNTACQIFIGSLHPTVIESDLYTLTVQYGQVVHIRILRNIYTKEPMGLAFVSFSDAASAQRARAELNGVLFKGKHINVTLYCKPRNPSANIFVNSLPAEVTARDLDQIFKQFGPIVSTKVSYDPSSEVELLRLRAVREGGTRRVGPGQQGPDSSPRPKSKFQSSCRYACATTHSSIPTSTSGASTPRSLRRTCSQSSGPSERCAPT